MSFDRAAEYYDATRGYPPGVDDALRDALVARLGLAPGARFLELGVGTGRIALPFIRAGFDYTGVDISRQMLARLRAKLDADSPRLVVGDVMRVPLAPAAFDVVVMVHVLHLVDDWRAVLDEARRLLRPGGRVVLANDEYVRPDPAPPPAQVWPAWSAILDDLGVPSEQRRAGAVRGLDEQFAEHLRAAGASVERAALLEYAGRQHSARDSARAFHERTFSSSWALPDDVHAEASRRLDRWLDEVCPDPDTPYHERNRTDALIATF